MSFEMWLAECNAVITKHLNYSADLAGRMISGAGLQIYRAKFERGMTPQQCVDDELIYCNE